MKFRAAVLIVSLFYTSNYIFPQNFHLSDKLIKKLTDEDKTDTLNFYTQKIEKSIQTQDSLEIANSLYGLGNYCYENYYLESTVECLSKSFSLYEELESYEDMIESLNLLGITQNMLSEYTEALNTHKQALNLSKSINNKY